MAIPLPVGGQLGDFVIEGLIGSGGMGSVYRALDKRHGRTVALKILSTDVRAEDPGAEARFAREAQAIGDVTHPAIARVHHSGMDDGVPWISMQYVEGENLADLLRQKGPGPLSVAIRVLTPVAEALDELHGVRRHDSRAAATIHRDIKPANIIVSPRGTPGPAATLVDFGIARRVDGLNRLTATTSVTGTQGYLAPEAVTSDGDLRGPAADQYSLAVVAYHMLTGRLPFPDAVLTPEVHRRYAQDLTPPSQVVGSIPRAVDLVFVRALATASDQRFPACLDFVAALSAAAQDTRAEERVGGRPEVTKPLTSSLRPPSSATTTDQVIAAPKSRRRRAGKAMVVFAVLVLIGGAVIVAPRVIPAATAEDFPSEVRTAFPGFIPADSGSSGFGGATCDTGEVGAGVVVAVACSANSLAYQAYVLDSPERRDVLFPATGKPEVTLQAGESCTVRVVDVGEEAASGLRTVSVLPEDSRRASVLLATVPAQTWEEAQAWAASAPLCS